MTSKLNLFLFFSKGATQTGKKVSRKYANFLKMWNKRKHTRTKKTALEAKTLDTTMAAKANKSRVFSLSLSLS
jgi:hypothetical protein